MNTKSLVATTLLVSTAALAQDSPIDPRGRTEIPKTVDVGCSRSVITGIQFFHVTSVFPQAITEKNVAGCRPGFHELMQRDLVNGNLHLYPDHTMTAWVDWLACGMVRPAAMPAIFFITIPYSQLGEVTSIKIAQCFRMLQIAISAKGS